MLLIHLGYEREGLEKSEKTDIPHGWFNDDSSALCGVELKTSFQSLLFATPGGLESDGTSYNTLAHTEIFGNEKCKKCLSLAAKYGER